MVLFVHDLVGPDAPVSVGELEPAFNKIRVIVVADMGSSGGIEGDGRVTDTPGRRGLDGLDIPGGGPD